MTKEQKTDNLILLLMSLGAVIFHITLNDEALLLREADMLEFLGMMGMAP